MSVIRAEDLRKTYRTGFWMRPVEAVRGVSFEVAQGEIFGFIGPNGAGKTTSIKLLTGLIQPTSGQCWIQGLPSTDPDSRRKLGFLPEGTFFHEYLTAREFLHFHGALLGVPREQREQRIPRLLERVGLSEAADRQIRRYSKGMRQRAGLAQALIGEPDVVILDEPMSGLDPLGRKEVRDLILGLRDEGKSVFFTSHILQDAEVICDSVAIILGGRVVQQGYLDDLLGQEIRGVEIVAEGLSEALFEELRATSARAVVQGGRFLFELDDESQADKVIVRLREGGARLRSLVPRRRSLEDLLVAGIAKEGRG
jgi:ABC-2 type transport system ATP-binding protein